MKRNYVNERKNESGAIMLEIIAVLALSGVMGALLFRQINHRNQELHNIQMASEIRIVKEAFNAWIQANLAPLRRDCPLDESNIDDIITCSSGGYSSSTLATHVKEYVPNGFLIGDALNQSYELQLFGHWVGNSATKRPVYFGAVIPKEGTLPDGGVAGASWNFKRAARVAMLIGGDGGAYDPNITKDAIDGGPMTSYVVGSVGTWKIEADNSGSPGKINVLDMTQPRYVALTGLDVFQPEVELPDIQVSIPNDWSLALHDTGVYGKFVIGDRATCFNIGHTSTDSVDNMAIVGSDQVYDVSASGCDAVFWVDNSNTNADVYVRNNLHVGHDVNSDTSAVDIKGSPTTAGMIAISDAQGKASIVLDGEKNSDRTLTIKDGKILTNQTTGKVGANGHEANYQYQLDPANTSVMYDIRLGSIGGMKLSDLLPDIILKATGIVINGNDVRKPECPDGFNRGILVIPSVPSITTESVTSSSGNPINIRHMTGPTVQIQIDNGNAANNTLTAGDAGVDAAWQVNFTGIESASYQTYCVKGSIVDDSAARQDAVALNETTCNEMGLDWNGMTNTCGARFDTDEKVTRLDTEAVCRSAGFVWRKGECHINRPARPDAAGG